MLFSDGGDTAGPDPEAAAALAADAGVHIETIGIGTTQGTTIEVDGYQVATALDEDLLTSVAEITGGSYHPATDAAALNDIHRSIDLRVTTQEKLVELTAPLAGGALAVADDRRASHDPLVRKDRLMSLNWPWALAALLVVPSLLFVRWWMSRRRRRIAVRVSSVALIRAALPGRPLWRRRIPIILFLSGLLALGAGVARPQASVRVPSNSTTILLAIDVSSSMCSTDIAPNRFDRRP